MLQSMRSSVGSWSIKILLTVLVLSFVSFYGWQAGQGCNPSGVATVNGEQITIREYQNRVRSVLENYRALGFIRGDVSEEMLGSLKDNVLTGMINERLKVRAAHKMGISASEEKVRDTIQKQFSSSGGEFDFELYKRILMNRLNTTPGAFERSYADSEIAQLFDQILEKTAWVTDQELKDTYALRNEKVNLEYVELNADQLGKDWAPSPPPRRTS